MKVLFALLLLCIAAPSVTKADEFDVRRVRWGMSIDEVKKTEQNEPVAEKTGATHIVGYEDEIAGIKTLVGYFFENGKLFEVRYKLYRDSFPDEMLSQNYRHVKALLSEKYGKSTEVYKQNRIVNLNRFSAYDIENGTVQFIDKWETKRTLILLGLLSVDGEASFEIKYTIPSVFRDNVKKLNQEHKKKL